VQNKENSNTKRNGRKQIEFSIKKDLFYLILFSLTAHKSLQKSEDSAEDALHESRTQAAKKSLRLIISGLGGVLKKSYLYIRCGD